MANVKFNRKELEKHFPLTKENIEKISLFGTPLESLTTEEIEIEVFPNRPDLLSLEGFIRGFKTFLGKSSGLKQYAIKKPEKNFRVEVESSVDKIRPFTACAIVKNLKLNKDKIKDIISLQEKLHSTLGRDRKKVAIGIYPLEKIKLPIKYEALAPEKIKFVPLESDIELDAKQILEKHPTGREYAHLLSNFDKFPVFKDADKKILSMPPIVNSAETGRVTEKTKDVFIECSGFELQTLNKALNIISTALADMGGTIYQIEVSKKGRKNITPNLAPETMKISIENINKLLGLDLKEKDIEKLLKKMGHDYKNKSVLIPAWRTDILHEVDIAEDIAIAYGYDSFKPEIPNVATTGEELKESRIKSKISEILIGLGFLETQTYHLIKHDEAKSFKESEKIQVEDSKTEYKYLRPNLLVPALRIFSENKDSEYPQKTFEIGTIFSHDKSKKTETGIIESESLIISSAPGNFNDAKQSLDYLMRMLGIQYKIEESSEKVLIEGRTASLSVNNKKIGYLGETHPETLREWNIKMPLSIIEISLEEIFNLLQKDR